jgi:Rrf2 family nitric oxide-sensitive transcriptional repressor
VHNLSRGGFIKSYRGKGGGIELARDPGQINIGEVVRYTEGPLKPVECFDVERNRCVIANVCGLADVIAEACDSFFATRSLHPGRSRQARAPEQNTRPASRPQLNRGIEPPAVIVFEGPRTREGQCRR